MAGPIDAIVAIHNAFRADTAAMDAAALAAARGKPGLEAKVERFRFFNEVLAWHAHGEEPAIFPALEQVAPLSASWFARWSRHTRTSATPRCTWSGSGLHCNRRSRIGRSR